MDRDPSRRQTEAFQSVYGHFSRTLFSDFDLPNVQVTFNRKGRSIGYFKANEWSDRIDGQRVHTLNLNPDHLGRRTEQVAQTIAHEQVHVWQKTHGKPSRGGHHNREWEARMRAIGLEPRFEKLKNGGNDRQRVSQTVIPGGAFERAFARLDQDVLLPLVSATKADSSRNKVGWACLCCTVWGAPDLRLRCERCRQPLRAK